MLLNRTNLIEIRSARYLGIFGTLATAVLGIVVLANYLVDPSMIHQWDSAMVQRLRPPSEKLDPWVKTYAIFKYQPQVLYVGNSRTEVGLPPDPRLFGGKRVFNGAISGGSVGDAIAMLQHSRSVTKLDTVVWGVDYWTFSPEIGNTDFDRDLVASGASYWATRELMNLKLSLSIDMTVDSVDFLVGRTRTVCRSSLAFYGQRDVACTSGILFDRGGSAKALVADIKAAKDRNEKVTQGIKAFSEEIGRLCASGTRTMVYINPTHALLLETLYRQGHGPYVEEWERLLVGATDSARKNGCDIHLFDFSGFNSITSESIPQVSGHSDMQNYWEGSHYRTSVGRLILARMIPIPDVSVPEDFGVQLDDNVIEGQLGRIRAEREAYRSRHPAESILLDEWIRPDRTKRQS